MSTWRRRSVLAACAAISTTGALASIGTAAADETESRSFAAGHPGGWSSSFGNAANSRSLSLDGSLPAPESVAWEYDETGAVAVADGRAYVRTDAEIHALDADTGDLEWRTEAPSAEARPTVADGHLYASGEERVAAVSTADGETAWERAFDTNGPIPAPTVAFETVYVVVDGTLYALDAADGSTRWRRETVNAASMDSRFNGTMALPFRPETVAVANGTVYAALEGGTDGNDVEYECAFGAVDAETGDDRWAIAFHSTHPGPVIGPIIATGHAVYANHNDEGGFEFDLESGDVIETDHVVRGGTANARLDVGIDMGRTITGYNWETDQGWTATSNIDAWGEFLVAGETVIARHEPYQSDTADYPHDSIVGLDLADGTVRWTLEFDDAPPEIVAADPETLYVDDDGSLVAYRSSDAVPDEEDDADEDDEPDESADEDGDESDNTEDSDSSDDVDDEDNAGEDDDSDGAGEDDDVDDADDAGEDDGDDADDADDEDNVDDAGEDDDSDGGDEADEDDADGDGENNADDNPSDADDDESTETAEETDTDESDADPDGDTEGTDGDGDGDGGSESDDDGSDTDEADEDANADDSAETASVEDDDDGTDTDESGTDADDDGNEDDEPDGDDDTDDDTDDSIETDDDVDDADEADEDTDDSTEADDTDDTIEADDDADDTMEADDGADDADDADDTDDEPAAGDEESMPGFTTGAGLLGGAATLEWLRRRAAAATQVEPAEPTDALDDESAE